jgi:predicted ThiF/HesA family dinucleotide-utilizing enzyme
MLKSTFLPQTWHDVTASTVRPNIMGIQGSIAPGTSQNIDTLVVDDSLFRGIKLIATNTVFGDTVSVKVVDVNGVYSPAGTILAAPVLNFNINSDQQLQADYESIAPFKIPGGVYLRVTYNSTGGLLSNVKIGVDLFLETVLL